MAQICSEVDREDLLSGFEKEQKSLVQKKKRQPLDRFRLALINNLVRDKKFDFNEMFQAIDD